MTLSPAADVALLGVGFLLTIYIVALLVLVWGASYYRSTRGSISRYHADGGFTVDHEGARVQRNEARREESTGSRVKTDLQELREDDQEDRDVEVVTDGGESYPIEHIAVDEDRLSILLDGGWYTVVVSVQRDGTHEHDLQLLQREVQPRLEELVKKKATPYENTPQPKQKGPGGMEERDRVRADGGDQA